MLYSLYMIWFKILLIILVAAPVIVTATVLYLQLFKYIRIKNREDMARKR